MLGACGMQRYHQEALKKNRVMLARELVLKELMEHMIEKDIITIEMVEMIQVCTLNSTALLFLPEFGVTLSTGSIVKFMYFLPVCLVLLCLDIRCSRVGLLCNLQENWKLLLAIWVLSYLVNHCLLCCPVVMADCSSGAWWVLLTG